ncbi:hypothetical protein Q2463_27035, partial [Escherichia coli]|nr:hypothetical protein [Escherichia coli]
LGGLDRIHLLLELADVAFGLAHRLAQLGYAGGEFRDLGTLALELVLQGRDLLRDFPGQLLVAGLQCLDRVLLVLGDLGRALLDA